MIDLAGRHVAVTGGGRGIGAACCRRFARAGATVLVHYVEDERSAGEVLAELRAISERPHALFRADLARPEEARELIAEAERQWGRLDCLVNNAGIWGENRLDALDWPAYRRTLDVNVGGSFAATAAALPLLARSSDGSVVNLSSTAGQRGEAGHSPYAAAKGAMIAATKSWAVELAPAVRVNAVAPGWVATDMTAEALAADGGDARRRAAAEIPLGRIAEPDDVAGPVVFLASSLARHITGEVLNVNGGSVLAG